MADLADLYEQFLDWERFQEMHNPKTDKTVFVNSNNDTSTC